MSTRLGLPTTQQDHQGQHIAGTDPRHAEQPIAGGALVGVLLEVAGNGAFQFGQLRLQRPNQAAQAQLDRSVCAQAPLPYRAWAGLSPVSRADSSPAPRRASSHRDGSHSLRDVVVPTQAD